jgi:large subunit ribosomal protein L7/L12
MDQESLAEQLGQLTGPQLVALTKELEKRWGVSATPTQPTGVLPTVPVAEAPPEQTEFSVVLEDAGATRITVIKEVRAVTGLGLKEAKDLVESLPKTIKEGIPKEEAEGIQAQLTQAGARVVVR